MKQPSASNSITPSGTPQTVLNAEPTPSASSFHSSMRSWAMRGMSLQRWSESSPNGTTHGKPVQGLRNSGILNRGTRGRVSARVSRETQQRGLTDRGYFGMESRLASATRALDIRYVRGREVAPNPQGYIFLQRVIASPELSPRGQKHRERAHREFREVAATFQDTQNGVRVSTL